MKRMTWKGRHCLLFHSYYGHFSWASFGEFIRGSVLYACVTTLYLIVEDLDTADLTRPHLFVSPRCHHGEQLGQVAAHVRIRPVKHLHTRHLRIRLRLGSGIYRSPRHRMLHNSINEGSQRASMT